MSKVQPEAEADAQSAGQSQAQSAGLHDTRSSVQSLASSGDAQCQAESAEQLSQAPQDSGESDAPQHLQSATRFPPQSHKAAFRHLSPPSSALRHSVNSGRQRRYGSPRTEAPAGCQFGSANPSSDGRTVVVNGFTKGVSGTEARQQALDACAPFGQVSYCWLRKGKSSCWFSIVQFAEVSLYKLPAPGLAVAVQSAAL